MYTYVLQVPLQVPINHFKSHSSPTCTNPHSKRLANHLPTARTSTCTYTFRPAVSDIDLPAEEARVPLLLKEPPELLHMMLQVHCTGGRREAQVEPRPCQCASLSAHQCIYMNISNFNRAKSNYMRTVSLSRIP